MKREHFGVVLCLLFWATGATILHAGEAKDIAALVDQLNGKDKVAAYRAELALWDLREKAIPSLVADLQARAAAGEPTWGAHTRLLLAIGRDSVPPLLKVLKEGGPAAPSAARLLAGLHNVQGIDFFRARLDDPDVMVRLDAVNEVAHARVSAEMPKLEKLLKTDPEKSIRRAAALAISRIGGPRAVELLVEEATNEDSEIRKAAAKFLSFIDPERALPIVLDLVSQPSGRTLIWVLRDMADPRAVPVLIQLLNTPDGLVRHTAAEALAGIGDRRAISPLIRTLVEEKQGDFHDSVAPALRRLAGQDFGYFHGAPNQIRRHALSRWYSWEWAGCPDWPQEKPPVQEISAALETLLQWAILGEPLAGAPERGQFLGDLRGLSDHETIVLFGDNLPPGLDISLPGKEVLLLTRQQAHERADAEGDYFGIQLDEPRVASGFAEITLHAIRVAPAWGRTWGLSFGTILLRKEDGKWRFHAWEGGGVA